MLTDHARLRARQMGVGTKRVKRMARDFAATTYAGGSKHQKDARILLSAGEPTLALVYLDRPNDRRLILSVLERRPDHYTRSDA